MSDVTHLDLALNAFCRRSSDPDGEPARILAQYNAALRTEILALDGQAYDGELVMLRGLVATLNAIANHGDLSDVQKLLREHAGDDAEARGLTTPDEEPAPQATDKPEWLARIDQFEQGAASLAANCRAIMGRLTAIGEPNFFSPTFQVGDDGRPKLYLGCDLDTARAWAAYLDVELVHSYEPSGANSAYEYQRGTTKVDGIELEVCGLAILYGDEYEAIQGQLQAAEGGEPS